MIPEHIRLDLEKQGYRMVGNHSTVKVCGWTRKMIKGQGGCYKLKFYGIMSNQCLQMSTSLSCANRCVFCWRGYKAPVSTKWEGDIDEPEDIVEGSLKVQEDLLMGFNGNPNVNRAVYEASRAVKHVALSLTGEPIMYPRINETINNFHSKGISTFLVTNAQYPKEIKNLAPVTQLYLSIDAPTKEILKDVDKPLYLDYWERMIGSLDALAEKKHRTCIRLTLIKHLNMCNLEEYADLIKRGQPDFVEAKGYMFVGASRQRLTLDNMPLHEEVRSFARHLLKLLPDYELVSEHIPSRVLMFAKKKFKKEDGWHTWIDFDAFIANSELDAKNYSRKNPEGLVGIGNKGTLDNMSDEQKKKVLSKRSKDDLFIDEFTDELDFWSD